MNVPLFTTIMWLFNLYYMFRPLMTIVRYIKPQNTLRKE